MTAREQRQSGRRQRGETAEIPVRTVLPPVWGALQHGRAGCTGWSGDAPQVYRPKAAPAHLITNVRNRPLEAVQDVEEEEEEEEEEAPRAAASSAAAARPTRLPAAAPSLPFASPSPPPRPPQQPGASALSKPSTPPPPPPRPSASPSPEPPQDRAQRYLPSPSSSAAAASHGASTQRGTASPFLPSPSPASPAPPPAPAPRAAALAHPPAPPALPLLPTTHSGTASSAGPSASLPPYGGNAPAPRADVAAILIHEPDDEEATVVVPELGLGDLVVDVVTSEQLVSMRPPSNALSRGFSRGLMQDGLSVDASSERGDEVLDVLLAERRRNSQLAYLLEPASGTGTTTTGSLVSASMKHVDGWLAQQAALLAAGGASVGHASSSAVNPRTGSTSKSTTANSLGEAQVRSRCCLAHHGRRSGRVRAGCVGPRAPQVGCHPVCARAPQVLVSTWTPPQPWQHAGGDPGAEPLASALPPLHEPPPAEGEATIRVPTGAESTEEDEEHHHQQHHQHQQEEDFCSSGQQHVSGASSHLPPSNEAAGALVAGGPQQPQQQAQQQQPPNVSVATLLQATDGPGSGPGAASRAPAPLPAGGQAAAGQLPASSTSTLGKGSAVTFRSGLGSGDVAGGGACSGVGSGVGPTAAAAAATAAAALGAAAPSSTADAALACVARQLQHLQQHDAPLDAAAAAAGVASGDAHDAASAAAAGGRSSGSGAASTPVDRQGLLRHHHLRSVLSGKAASLASSVARTAGGSVSASGSGHLHESGGAAGGLGGGGVAPGSVGGSTQLGLFGLPAAQLSQHGLGSGRLRVSEADGAGGGGGGGDGGLGMFVEAHGGRGGGSATGRVRRRGRACFWGGGPRCFV